MNTVLWILQVLLAVMYLAHGWWFVAWPAASVERMRQQNPSNSVLAIPAGFRRFIGVAEWLAAAGLVLPGLTGILPWLTSLAALGLMIVMGSATLLHLSKRETPMAIFTGVAFVLVTFVAYMRWQVIPL
jgi:uncharacterized membrane protein YphA (DoxX/SURF4 family)